MTAIPDTDGRLPPCAQTKVGSGPALGTLTTRGSVRGRLTVPLHGFSNLDRNHKTTMLAAEPPATVAAIPVKGAQPSQAGLGRRARSAAGQ
jgi:hypothetical protein